MWTAFIDLIFKVLQIIYGVVRDWGLAIIVLTVLFRLLLWPLTIKQTRSTTSMQKVQPLMKEIQEKYADDKQKQNEEMMKLYSEHKVNPLSGCLPMLIPMPLLFAFYSVLAAPVVDKQGIITKVSGPLAKFLGFKVGETFSAAAHVNGSFLGIIPDIMLSPKAALVQGFLPALPYFIVLAIFGLSIILPSLMMPQQADNAQARQQKMMSFAMAAMMLYVGYNIPAGALLYYDVSSLIAAGQQFLTQRSLKKEGNSSAREIVIESGKTKKKK